MNKNILKHITNKKSKKQYVAFTLYKETKRILNMLGKEDWNSNYTELALYRLMKKI